MIENLKVINISNSEPSSNAAQGVHVPDGEACPAAGAGLPALELAGVPLLWEPLTTETLGTFFFPRPASDISPPVASPSLMAPVAAIAR